MIATPMSETQWNRIALKGWMTFPKRAKYLVATPVHPEAGECEPVTLEVNDGSFYVDGVIVKSLTRIASARFGSVLVDTGASWRDAVEAVERAIAGSWHATAVIYCMNEDDRFLGNNLPAGF